MLQSQRLRDSQQLQDASENNPALGLDSNGEGVQALQRALRDLGHDMAVSFAGGDADGIYGQESVDTVIAFQADADFEPANQDGSAGTNTLNALDDVFLRSEISMALDDLKSRWFLDVDAPPVPFPPIGRYPGSQHAAFTDDNLVTPQIDGQNFMRDWHDTLRAMKDQPGAELYHLSWLLNAVKTLGESVPASDALQVLADAKAGGASINILLSAHVPFVALNAAAQATLAASAVNNVFLDGRFPNVFGSHHQKVSVMKNPAVDEPKALLGSIDINSGRWDRMAHDAVDPERGVLIPGGTMSGGGSGGSVGVGGKAGPTHDFGIEVRGPAVTDVERTFRDRWEDPTMNPLPPALPSGLSSPSAAGTHSIQVLHTYGRTTIPPGHTWAPTGEFTVWASYLNAIQNAQKYIYIEDQYFLPFGFPPFFAGPPGTAQDSDIVFQLGEAIKRGVRVLVLVPSNTEDPVVSGNIIHQRSHGLHFLAETAAVNLGDFVVASLANGPDPVYVHAKLMLVDDELSLIGTANVNQRSMSNDSEIHLAIVEEEGTFAHELRKSLWQHHLELPGSILDHWFTACALFKRQTAASAARVRPFPTDPPGSAPVGHATLIGLVDPYSGPPR